MLHLTCRTEEEDGENEKKRSDKEIDRQLYVYGRGRDVEGVGRRQKKAFHVSLFVPRWRRQSEKNQNVIGREKKTLVVFNADVDKAIMIKRKKGRNKSNITE